MTNTDDFFCEYLSQKWSVNELRDDIIVNEKDDHLFRNLLVFGSRYDLEAKKEAYELKSRMICLLPKLVKMVLDRAIEKGEIRDYNILTKILGRSLTLEEAEELQKKINDGTK